MELIDPNNLPAIAFEIVYVEDMSADRLSARSSGFEIRFYVPSMRYPGKQETLGNQVRDWKLYPGLINFFEYTYLSSPSCGLARKLFTAAELHAIFPESINCAPSILDANGCIIEDNRCVYSLPQNAQYLLT